MASAQEVLRLEATETERGKVDCTILLEISESGVLNRRQCSTAQRSDLIWDAKRDEVHLVNHQARKIDVVSSRDSELRSLVAKLRPQIDLMKTMGSALGSIGGAALSRMQGFGPDTYSKTGKRRTALGLSCEDWAVVSISGERRTECLLGSESHPAFQRAGEWYQSIKRRLSVKSQIVTSVVSLPVALDRGIPVLVDGPGSVRVVVQSIKLERRSVAALPSQPDGYRVIRRDLGSMFNAP
jgi:hypothetical protein